jgi:DNA polymerase-4
MKKILWPAYFYIDFDSFFASAEQYRMPDYAGRPLGVLPMPSPHSGCIAVSKEAKRLGVRNGMKQDEARQLVPDMIFVHARHDDYVRLHHAIVALMKRHLEVRGTRSIDEVVCYLYENEAHHARAIALKIKADLARSFHPCLTGSIGVAPNELLAKIAAEMNKPDGLVILTHDMLPQALSHLPLRDLPGISTGMETRLNRAGVFDVAALYALQPKQARKIWNSVEGERFLALLQGYDITRPATQKRMFGHSRILPWSWRDYGKMRDCARLLLIKAARRMRREGYCATELTLALRSQCGQKWAASRRFAEARDDHTVLLMLEALLQHMPAGMKYASMSGSKNRGAGEKRPKSVTVFLHGLVAETQRQGDLFENVEPQGGQAKARWEAVCDLGDALHRKFGRSVLSLGLQEEPPGGYAGGKIAFNRIPDALDFERGFSPPHDFL